jgi:hypothetical protein
MPDELSAEDRNFLLYVINQALPQLTAADCERARKLREWLAGKAEAVEEARNVYK